MAHGQIVNATKGHTVILGAGPAGMATAMELWKAGVPSTIVERNTQVGGLARTLLFRESADVFRTDIGPHRFFSKNPYLYDFIEELLGSDWIEVKRLTRFFIGGKLYLYPIAWKNALRNLGVGGATQLLVDYLGQRTRAMWIHEEPRNFEEFAVRMFGRTLAELNILNYTEKIWGLPCAKLSVDWAHQRIRGLSFASAVKNALFSQGGSRGGMPKSLVDRFYYPAYGTGLIYEKIRERIGSDAAFLFSSRPVRIRHHEDSVSVVDVETPAGIITLSPKVVVSSIPITDCLTLLDPAPPRDILDHARALRYRSQVYLFITLNLPSVIPDQWMYFPEKTFRSGASPK